MTQGYSGMIYTKLDLVRQILNEVPTHKCVCGLAK